MPSRARVSETVLRVAFGRDLPPWLTPGTAIASISLGALLLLSIALSSRPWAFTTTLPHSHSPFFDTIYYILDPLVLYLVTGVLTFALLSLPRFVSLADWRVHTLELKTVPLRALVLFTIATVGLLIIEEGFKQGVGRARPVAQAEHSLIAAKLEGWLPQETAALLRGYEFECPVGQLVFAQTTAYTDDQLLFRLVETHRWSLDDARAHLASIHRRTGIATGIDLDEHANALAQLGVWRRKNLLPILSASLPTWLAGHKVDDIDGSAPSGHVLRQGFMLLLFLLMAIDRVGPYVFRWESLWKTFLLLHLFSMLVCVWSRVYGYDHSWSDEMISLSVTVGILSFALMLQRNALRSREGIVRMLFDGPTVDLMRTLRLIVIAYDKNGKILLWNREAERVTGYSADEVPNLKEYVRRVYRRHDPDLTLQRIRRVMAEPVHGRNIISAITSKSGVGRVIVWNGTQIPDPDGSISGRLSVGFEISRFDRRLADVGAAAASLVHDIRNEIRRTRQRSAVALSPEVALSLLRISEMCDSYGDYVKGNLGTRRTVSPASLIDFALVALSDEATRVRVALVKKCQTDGPPILGEEYLLRHAVTDLVRNAITASIGLPHPSPQPQHEVHIGTRHIDRDGTQYIAFEVSDSGPGLPAELHEWLSEGPLYEDVDEAQREAGLGLLLASIAARDHGGWIESERRMGRHVITLTLPVVHANVSDLSPNPATDVSDLRFLA